MKDPSWHVLNLPRLHLTSFESVPCHGYLLGSRTVTIGSASLLVWLQFVWKISKQKVRSRNLCYWQQIEKAGCNLGCSSLWQNWASGVCVNFKSTLEDVSRLDRLHAPKLLHNILLMVWKSTLTCWLWSSKVQLSGTVYVDSILFFCMCWKQLRNFMYKELHWKVVFWNDALFLLNLSQLPNSFLLNFELYAYL